MAEETLEQAKTWDDLLKEIEALSDKVNRMSQEVDVLRSDREVLKETIVRMAIRESGV